MKVKKFSALCASMHSLRQWPYHSKIAGAGPDITLRGTFLLYQEWNYLRGTIFPLPGVQHYIMRHNFSPGIHYLRVPGTRVELAPSSEYASTSELRLLMRDYGIPSIICRVTKT